MKRPKRFFTIDEKHDFIRRVDANINRGMNVTRAAHTALRPLKLHQRIEVVRAIRCIFRMPEPGAS